MRAARVLWILLAALTTSGVAQGEWYKGNLHTHSFWSDGVDFPEVIAQRFKSQGYHFIAFTEHDRHQAGEVWVGAQRAQMGDRTMPGGTLETRYREAFGPEWVESRQGSGGRDLRLKPVYEYRHLVEEPGRFMILNGEEVTVKFQGGEHWVNVINVPSPIGPQTSAKTSVEALQRVVEVTSSEGARGGRPVLAVLNHPNYRWNALAEDVADAAPLRFMEIHTALNSTFSYGDSTRAGAERIWDIALATRLSAPGGGLLFGLATDDCHRYHGDDLSAHPCRAWIVVQADRLTPERIVRAMCQGDFYASTGVTLSALQAGPQGISLRVQPEAGVHYVTRFVGTRRGADLQSTAIVDKDGKPLRTTRRYSKEIGEELSEVAGLEAYYRFTGNELYVRAVVTSDKQHLVPTVPGDVVKAWTQPVRPGK